LRADWATGPAAAHQAKLAAAQAQFDQAHYQLQDVHQALVAALVQAFVKGHYAKEDARLLEAQLQLEERLQQLDHARYARGLQDVSALHAATLRLEGLKLRLSQARTQQHQALLSLATLLGQPCQPQVLCELHQRWFAPSVALAVPCVPSVLAIELGALAHRPDVAAAHASLLQADAQCAVARWARWPSIDLSGFFGVRYLSGQGLTGPAWSIGSALRWPLWDAAGLRSQAQAAQASVRQAMLLYQEAQHKALEDTRLALAHYLEAMVQWQGQQARLQAQSRVLALHTLREQRGLQSTYDTLVAQVQQLQLQQDCSLAQQQALASYIALQRALGAKAY
jgi:outer membrane protein TolC